MTFHHASLAAACAAASLQLGNPAIAHAAVSTTTSQAAWLTTVAPPTVLNFDAIADATAVANQYQPVGVTFSPFNGGVPTAVTESNPHSAAQTLTVDPAPLSAGGGVSLSFSAPAAGFGLWFNDSQFAGNTVALFGTAGQVLATYELPYPHPTEWRFVGFTSSLADIARVDVALGPEDRVTFDDLMVAAPVPEPAPAALLVAGGGLLAWLARRRRGNGSTSLPRLPWPA